MGALVTTYTSVAVVVEEHFGVLGDGADGDDVDRTIDDLEFGIHFCRA